MKKTLKYTLIGAISLGGMLASCTDSFEDFNKNKIAIDEEQMTYDYNHIGAYFPAMQQMIYCNFNWGWGTDWTFQVMQNLNADLFSGYMASVHHFDNGNVNMQTYTYLSGWVDPAWNYTYAYMMPSTLKVEKECKKDYDSYAHFDAVNKLLKLTAMARLSDMYGPVIYSQYGNSKTGGTYDSVQELYDNFFKDLDTAVDILNAYVTANPGNKPFERFDMAYGGNYVNWIKYANTLRLRLAMRIVKADAAKAKLQAEKAVNAAHGLIETNSDNFTISGKGYTHPLTGISKYGEWGNVSISANIESILSGYNDTRFTAIAVPARKGAFAGKVKGMRCGIHNLADLTYGPVVSSPIYFNNALMPALLMTASEASFLRAEGVLRGWNMGSGTAKSFYEDGITKSFDQWGAPMGEYLKNENLAADFTDQLQPATESSPAVCKVSPKWDESASNEVKLEKIITQKWIAGFPEGYNAWAELRRTGYPKLIPISNNTSSGINAIPTETGFRRVKFSAEEVGINPAGVADAISKLGGPDSPNTRIWWDVNKSNF